MFMRTGGLQDGEAVRFISPLATVKGSDAIGLARLDSDDGRSARFDRSAVPTQWGGPQVPRGLGASSRCR